VLATSNTVEQGVRNDPKVITIHARQGGIEAPTYDFDLPNACGLGRIGAQQESRLTVTVLGNPVTGSQAAISLTGAVGPIPIQVLDVSGRPISFKQVKSALPEERIEVHVGQTPGVHLVRVSTPTQSETVKLIKD
jgi:hypothetical protein